MERSKVINFFKNLFRKTKDKYPYYCPQPENAQSNDCGYLGFPCDRGYGNRCLMPYKGCNLQRLEKDKGKYD